MSRSSARLDPVDRLSAPATPAAASLAVHGLLTSVRRRADVLAVLRRAVVLAVPAGGVVRTVAIVTAAGVQTPNAVRLAADPPPSIHPRTGVQVWIGSGTVELPGAAVRISRWWDSTVRPSHPHPAAVRVLGDRLAAVDGGVPERALGPIRNVHSDADPASWAAAARSVLGLGGGLTPAADDVVSGALVGLHATGRGPLARAIGALLAPHLADRTTTLSADLIRLAAAGHAGGEVLRLLRALAADPAGAHRRAVLEAAVAAVFDIGHSSGAALATGLVTALDGSLRVQR